MAAILRAVLYSGFFVKREEFSRVETSSRIARQGQHEELHENAMCRVCCGDLCKLAQTLARMVDLTWLLCGGMNAELLIQEFDNIRPGGIIVNSVRVVDGEARGQNGLKCSCSLRKVGMGKSLSPSNWCGRISGPRPQLCPSRLKPIDHWLGMVRGKAWP